MDPTGSLNQCEPAAGLGPSDGTDNFVWDQQNLLQTRAAGTNAKALQFTSGPGTWGSAVSQWSPAANASAFYCFDQSGNARLATQGVGNYVMTADYLMFGKEHILTGNGTLVHYFGGNWGYFLPINPAYHYYIRQRWYDSLNGQWLSKDPIWPRGRFNPYQFVKNNPVTRRDPSGNQSITWPISNPGFPLPPILYPTPPIVVPGPISVPEPFPPPGIAIGGEEDIVIGSCLADPACEALIASLVAAGLLAWALWAAYNYFEHTRGGGTLRLQHNDSCTDSYEAC